MWYDFLKSDIFCHRSHGHYLWLCQGWHLIKPAEMVWSVPTLSFSLMKNYMRTYLHFIICQYILKSFSWENHGRRTFSILKGLVTNMLVSVPSSLRQLHTSVICSGDWTAKKKLKMTLDTDGSWHSKEGYYRFLFTVNVLVSFCFYWLSFYLVLISETGFYNLAHTNLNLKSPCLGLLSAGIWHHI